MLTTSNRYTGLTLIEVLVALFVLSLGAFSLAMAGAESMRLARDSMHYSIALAAGNDLLDLQRVLLGHHPQLMGSASFSSGQSLSASPGCALEPCEPHELQAYLQSFWQCSLSARQGCPEQEGLTTLPGFDVEFLVNGASGDLRLSLQWRAKDQVRHLELESQVR